MTGDKYIDKEKDTDTDGIWSASLYAGNALSVIGLCTTGSALLTSDDADVETIHDEDANQHSPTSQKSAMVRF